MCLIANEEARVGVGGEDKGDNIAVSAHIYDNEGNGGWPVVRDADKSN